jgi:alpha-L-fucosidase 2
VPVQISPRTGKIQEWIEDYKEPELGHRHLSHVYSVFPAAQISTTTTPELAQAAVKTIEARLRGNPNAAVEEAKNRYKSWDSYLNGEGGGNWQRAWLSCLWARLGNSAQAYDSHYKQVAKILMPNLLGDVMQQIDGNFGATAAVAEMLLQSHAGQIQLLPALPTEWNTGAVKGLRARGGYEIDMAWQSGNLTQTTIKSTVGGTCQIKAGQKISKIVSGKKSVAFTSLPDGEVAFKTKSGEAYQLLF